MAGGVKLNNSGNLIFVL